MIRAEEIARGLSAAQQLMLIRVCLTNGGGLNGYSENARTYRALERRGLIQGKSGQEWRLVHTSLGQQVRAILEKDNG